MADIVDVMNMGLRAGGVPRRIQDFYEGSEQAKTALELFGQARDELLRAKDWSFSRKVVSLTVLKGPPPAGGFNIVTPWTNIYPYPGFLFSYAYPSDCLDIRALIQPPGLMPDLDPLPGLFRVDNDPVPNVSVGPPPVASGPPAKVILCNVANALAVYRAQITSPLLWEPGYVAALVASLGKKFAVAFGEDPNAERERAGEAVATTQTAAEVRG